VTAEPAKSTNELAADRTELAVRRTLMAADRTLMAWIRTALSMISFGFTIYKILEAFRKSGGALPHEDTPRNVGLFLIGLGTASTVMGTIEYWQALKDMQSMGRISIWRPSFIIAQVLSVAGLLLFFSILVKLL
jgi:putative membrane protein